MTVLGATLFQKYQKIPLTSGLCPVFVFAGSAETVNDGQFHTVELVTFNRMLNLSVDGGEPTTLDSQGRSALVTGEAPLYVGGKRFSHQTKHF